MEKTTWTSRVDQEFHVNTLVLVVAAALQANLVFRF